MNKYKLWMMNKLVLVEECRGELYFFPVDGVGWAKKTRGTCDSVGTEYIPLVAWSKSNE